MLRLTLLALLLTSAALAAPVVQQDFAGGSLPPTMRLLGDAKLADGVVQSASQPGWARSGLEIGPLPVTSATWTIQYDFKPLHLGSQGQGFVSQSPSTHWYMVYVNAAGAINLHTKRADGWKQRSGSGKPVIEAGKWYTATLALSGSSLQYAVRERGSDQALWDSGPVSFDEIAKETICGLMDEAPDDAAKTEWDNVTIDTSNSQARAEMEKAARELEAQCLRKEQMEKTMQALRDRGLALLPTPQQVALQPGTLKLSTFTIAADKSLAPQADTVRKVLQEWLPGVPVKISPVGGNVQLRLASPDSKQARPWKNNQGYELTVTPKQVELAAETPAGFFYGAQTLCQLAGRQPATATSVTLPQCQITDWPDIPSRLVMIATDQGGHQIIDVDYWKRLIRELAAAKINYVMPYFEGGTFYYEKYPFLGLKGRDGFTIEKGQLLSQYAKEHFIKIVPQQQTLGHSGSVLSHKELAHLQEGGGVYCSSKPETFAFLGDLFDELIAAFPESDYIHAGGDEFAHGFAQCPQCKARAEQIGKPGLYAEHMMHVRQILRDRGRGMMIWWHEQGYTEEAADKLAKDIVVFDWHYGNQSSYPSLERLQSKGFVNTWATPAVTRYYGSRNDWDNTFGNLSGFLAAGARRQVPGECTCTWVHGIWGGRNVFELNLCGVLFSGQCAWNSLASDYGDYRWRFARNWFGATADPQVLEGLMDAALHAPYGRGKEQGFWANNRIMEEMLAAPVSKTAEELQKKPELIEQARQLQGFCKQANEAIEKLRALATRNQVTLDYMAHDVHIHDTLARRLLLVAQLTELWPTLEDLPAADRAAKLQPVIEGFKTLAGDYTQMETMFTRSIKEAGGGRCGWGGWFPYITSGGVQFRAQQGREGVEKQATYLENLGAQLPDKPFAP